MKIFITIKMMLILGSVSFAQEARETTRGDLKSLCDHIVLGLKGKEFKTKSFQYSYEQAIWEFAGADPDKDTEEMAIPKIQKWWNKYKHKANCYAKLSADSLLKFSVDKNFKDLIETLLLNYELDVNFVEESDGKNVMDYISDEIFRREQIIDSKPNDSSKSLYYWASDLKEFGAKPGWQIKKKADWTAYDYFSSGLSLSRETTYRSKDLETNYQAILADYNKAIELNPKDGEVYYARALLNTMGKGDAARLNSAIADLTKAIQLKAKVGLLYELRADVYCRQGKKADSHNDREKVIEMYAYGAAYNSLLAAESGNAVEYAKKHLDEYKKGYSSRIKKCQ